MDEKILSVSALNRYIYYKFDLDYQLKDILIEAEISNFKHQSSGHLYFTLKDENSQIQAIMFNNYASKINFKVESGSKVIVKGSVTLYEKGGYYTFLVKEMKLSGIGDLYLEFERLKKELEALGYFSVNYKKPIPKFPKKIGVITSPTGAVIRDIINTIRRRYPFVEVILYPTMVQGSEAKFSIVKNIEKCNLDNLVDVIILARGGGSLEDLWPFNERMVADAIFNSKIPLISAVGHETDFTIADFVSDLRAATPTAAAELAVPDLNTLKKMLINDKELLISRYKRVNEFKKFYLTNLAKELDNLSPLNLLKEKEVYLNNLSIKLEHNIKDIITKTNENLNILRLKLNHLNPFKILDLGYSILEVNNKTIKSVNDVKEKMQLKTILKDGYIISEALEVKHGKS